MGAAAVDLRESAGLAARPNRSLYDAPGKTAHAHPAKSLLTVTAHAV